MHGLSESPCTRTRWPINGDEMKPTKAIKALQSMHDYLTDKVAIATIEKGQPSGAGVLGDVLPPPEPVDVVKMMGDK